MLRRDPRISFNLRLRYQVSDPSRFKWLEWPPLSDITRPVLSTFTDTWTFKDPSRTHGPFKDPLQTHRLNWSGWFVPTFKMAGNKDIPQENTLASSSTSEQSRRAHAAGQNMHLFRGKVMLLNSTRMFLLQEKTITCWRIAQALDGSSLQSITHQTSSLALRVSANQMDPFLSVLII